MNIMLVSQCSGQALAESRRILDQFAERRGDRVWQTSLTQAGLDTLRQLLRKTARKNTAVACHWLRGRDHSEILWIVGSAVQFNISGAVPTDSTFHNILREKDENDWHTLQDISLLAAMSALFHDIGKACQAFQDRLRKRNLSGNLYRHEWVSLRLFQSFIGSDSDLIWLERLTNPETSFPELLTNLQCDGIDKDKTEPPFEHLPPLARIIGFLIVSHHRLPTFPENGFRGEFFREVPNKILSSWNQKPRQEMIPLENPVPYWKFPYKTPFEIPAWRKRVSRIAGKLLCRLPVINPDDMLEDPFVVHISRLCLMLADHDYSSRTSSDKRMKIDSQWKAFANTDRKTGNLNQPLDEHLLGVEWLVGPIVRALPTLRENLPRISRHKGLRKRSADERFRWQDRAADRVEGIRRRSFLNGAFIVNMASTGCGKTLANARIMYGLNTPEDGMRCAFALGLRTLTRQTGEEYRKRLSLGEDEVAVLAGGAATRDLLDLYEKEAENSGSASVASLMDEDSHVFYEGNTEENPILNRLLDDPRAKNLLLAPILTCTIDHLVPATEGTRGGHQIAPVLRLLSGDLVLDELDDYDISDLPAITRLVHWAGLLGCRILISSATLPPSLVAGMFKTYREGRRHFQKNRGEHPSEFPPISCLWVDEFDVLDKECLDLKDFSDNHTIFAKRRRDRLSRQPSLRKGEILEVKDEREKGEPVHETFARLAKDSFISLHQRHHEVDPVTGKRVSFGLVRMANINPLVDVALALFKENIPEGYRIHLCVYHSQFPLLVRSAIENRLDRVLQRKDPLQVFQDPGIRHDLEACPEQDHLFIVLGSPVTEVGRDHDYDWAVVEPSSMRSLIQLAGRVLRHRRKTIDSPNILIFEKNVKAMEGRNPAYCKPGFENEGFLLQSHSLKDILLEEEWSNIDARARIVEREKLNPKTSLVDLEHDRLNKLMIPETDPIPAPRVPTRLSKIRGEGSSRLGAYSWWGYPKAMLTGILQEIYKFREDNRPHKNMVLLPDEDEEDYVLSEIVEHDRKISNIPVEKSLNHRIPDEKIQGERIHVWGETDYMSLLGESSLELGMNLRKCASRFGVVRLPSEEQGWRFHPALGFSSFDDRKN